MKKTLILFACLIWSYSTSAQVEKQQSFTKLKEQLDKVYPDKEAQGYKQYQRLSHYTQNHLDSEGRVVNSAVANYNAWEDWFSRKRSAQPATNVGNWTHLGPDSINVLGTVGLGRVNRIDFHPSDPDIVFASSAGGGLWKTTNAGNSWNSITDGFPILSTTGLAIDQSNPNNMYLLSGDGDGAFGSASSSLSFCRSSLGVFKTDNGGGTWTKTALTFSENSAVHLAFNIAIHPSNPNQLSVCTSRGLYTTQDGFATVDTVLRNEGRIYEVIHLSTNPDLAYAVSDTFVFKSYDGGLSWPQRFRVPAIEGKSERMSITAVNDQITLLASPSDSMANMRGLFIASETHNGQIPFFTKIATSPNILKSVGKAGSQANYDIALARNQSNLNQLVAGAIFMWDSNDGGVTWNMIERDSSYQKYHADIHDLQQNPLDGKLYCASDGGLYVSEDFGLTWVFKAVGMGITQYYRCAQSPFNAEMTLAGSQDNGNHFRENNDKTHRQVYWGDGMDVVFSPTDSLTSICPIHQGDTRLTTDGWVNSTQILSFEENDSVTWLTPISFDPHNDNILYFGSKPILKSIDQGTSWQASSVDSISANTFIEVAYNNSDIIYAGEYITDGPDRNELYLSEDAGISWSSIPFYGNTPRVSSLTINPEDDEEIWVSISGYDASKKVYRSIDKGDNWTNETLNLPDVPINKLVHVSSSASIPGSVYLATDIGVFYKHRTMTEWILFSNDLPAVEVTDLEIDYIEGRLLASTYGRGLWRSGLYRDCPNVLRLTGADHTFNKRYNFRTQDTLTSTATIDGFGGDVSYTSQGVIRLQQGFTASARRDAKLRARIKGCEE